VCDGVAVNLVAADVIARHRLESVRADVASFYEKRMALHESGTADWIVAVDGADVIGWIVISWNGKPSKPGHPDLVDIFVIEARRNLGIGTSVIAAAEKQVAKRGFGTVGLSVNPTENAEALRLYERLGYRSDGGDPYLDGVYDGNEDWVISLTKSLA
jgi:GNAT superfamily N-acetyltransferase